MIFIDENPHYATMRGKNNKTIGRFFTVHANGWLVHNKAPSGFVTIVIQMRIQIQDPHVLQIIEHLPQNKNLVIPAWFFAETPRFNMRHVPTCQIRGNLL